MGLLVYILGRSGTGKSFSMRNFDKKELGVINVQGKILPFKGAGAFDITSTDDSGDIVKEIKKMAKSYKSIVVDDFQYVMANEFMRRATERGYDKFTEIARHAWDIADCVRELPKDVIVYVLCHTDVDQDGVEKLKTIGRLLDEKIVLEGMSTIVLKTAVSDGQYMFLTQNNGHDTVKSPAGMFPSYAIDNDLKYVDEKIRNYYELGEFKTDEELKEIDEAVKHDDVPIKEEKKSRRRKKDEEKEESSETSKEEAKEKPDESESSEVSDSDTVSEPKRRSRKAAAEEVRKENGRKIAEANTTEDGTPIPYEDAEEPKTEELPKRKRRDKTEATEETPEESTAPRRRRRRA